MTGLLETVEYLLYHPSVSFIRFGDFDLSLLCNISTTTQNASTEIQSALMKIISNPQQNIAIGLPDIFGGYPAVDSGLYTVWYEYFDKYRIWLLKNIDLNRRYFQTWVTQLYILQHTNNCFNFTDIYSLFREIWKGKHILWIRGNNGQTYRYDVFDTAESVSVIYAPRYQAWAAYSSLSKAIADSPVPDMYIFTCGVVGKILAYDLSKAGKRALDLGHLPKDYDYFFQRKPKKDYYND